MKKEERFIGIKLKKGNKEVFLDKKDYERISAYEWFISNKGYAVAKIEGKLIPLHRFVMNAKEGEYVDHENRNRLDCRKNNLKIVTIDENNQNISGRGHIAHKGKKTSSKYRGVSFCTTRKQWRAQCKVNGRNRHVGWFDSEILASLAVKRFRKKHMKGSKT